MTAAAASSLRQTRVTILLSVNAAAVLIAGILIAGAIGLNGGVEFRVIEQRSDEVKDAIEQVSLIGSASNAETEMTNEMKSYITSIRADSGVSSAPVASGELWNEDSISIYQSANFDICAGGGLSNLGGMYWQTSNSSVIAGFYSSSRTWLGYPSDTCRYPIIVGTGTAVITAGTYDGSRHDSLLVTVLPIPEEQWKYEVLTLVNQERIKNGLGTLSWGESCAEAAQTRATELKDAYSHTRPDGTSWSTACPLPTDGGEYYAGENLMAGNSAVSPETVVAAWMNSEDHKANILNPNFTKLSVGFVFDANARYKTYWSQYFSNY